MVEKKGDSVGGGEPNPNRESQQEYFGVRAGEPTKPKEPTFKDFFGGHFSTAPYSRPKESLLEQFAKDPAVAEILRTRTRGEAERRSADLKALESYVASQPQPTSREEYGKLQTGAVQAVYEARAKRAYSLDESLLPAGEEALGVAPLALAPQATFTETWDRYKEALYAVASTTSLASELLRQEQFRTTPGSDVWKTLGSLAEKAVALSTLVRREIAAVPEGNGLVE